MTDARLDARGSPAGRAPTRAGAFAGTRVLVRLMLRRDRMKLPGWTIGISAFWIYITQLVPTVYGDAEDLRGIGEVFGGPMARMIVGPAYGFDELTIEVLMTGAYGLYALLLVALMNILLMVRHTRGDEQSGRIDLLRASVVGRQAPLCAAFVVALVTNLVVVLALIAVSFAAPELRSGATILFAVGVGLAGTSFAGVAALAAQVTAFSRAAAGLAGGVLGAAFLVRAIQSQRSEEISGRVQPVLATPVGRPVWLGSHLAVAAIGAVVLLAATGVATGAAAAVATGDAGLVWDGTISHVAYAPAVWTVVALAALMYGVAPRWIGLAWLLLGHALLVGVFGQLLDLPSWMNALSPFEHVARYPLEPLRWAPLVVLAAVATATAAAALAGFRRRDLSLG